MAQSVCTNLLAQLAMNKFREYEPKKCWVGDIQKICYATREEAEVAAKVAQYEHGGPELGVYKCEYGDHWHLTGNRHDK